MTKYSSTASQYESVNSEMNGLFINFDEVKDKNIKSVSSVN